MRIFLCYINQYLAHLPKERIWTRRLMISYRSMIAVIVTSSIFCSIKHKFIQISSGSENSSKKHKECPSHLP